MGPTADRIVDGPIVALDIFEYSRREEREQVDAQRLVDRILSESCAAIGASILGADWVDAGDGGFLLIQGDLRAGLHVLEAFVGRLADENRRRAEQFRVHLRFALHYGTVRLWDGRQGHNAAANALNESARLLAGMARMAWSVQGSARAKPQNLRYHRGRGSQSQTPAILAYTTANA